MFKLLTIKYQEINNESKRLEISHHCSDCMFFFLDYSYLHLIYLVLKIINHIYCISHRVRTVLDVIVTFKLSSESFLWVIWC